MSAPRREAALAWAPFLQKCGEITTHLDKSSRQLARWGVKRWLLGKTACALLQQEVRQMTEAITTVAQAVQAFSATPRPEVLRQLETQMQRLATEKAALQTRLPNLPQVSLIDDVITLLAPAGGMIWGILWKTGVLAAVSAWGIATPLIFGGLLLLKTTGRRLHIRLLTAKIEDSMALVTQIDELIHTFEKIEDKMHVSETLALRDETQALRQTVETQAEHQTAAIYAIVDKLATLENENATLKKMMEKVLKATGAEPS